jgi:hypothetical protein
MRGDVSCPAPPGTVRIPPVEPLIKLTDREYADVAAAWADGANGNALCSRFTTPHITPGLFIKGFGRFLAKYGGPGTSFCKLNGDFADVEIRTARQHLARSVLQNFEATEGHAQAGPRAP